MPGTQNQAVDFILADPELRDAAEAWAQAREVGEATTLPVRRLPRDTLYEATREFLQRVMASS
jgi:hypothetical protein